MSKIYTIGTQKAKLADLQELVGSLGIERILDWRKKPENRLSAPTMERAFPTRYKYVGDTCNEERITDAALNRLALSNQTTTLLLFYKWKPGDCPRHEKLGVPLHKRFGVEVTHVFDDHLVTAAELQRCIDADDEYAFTEWRSAPAAGVASTSNSPVQQLAPMGTISDLSDRAMLVRLSLCMPGFQRQNRQVSGEIAEKYGADATMGKFVESLIAKEATACLRQIESSLRQEYYSLSLPWDSNGTRIVSGAGYLKLVEFVRKGETQWDTAVEQFCDDWDAHVSEGKRKRGSLAQDSQYLTRHQVRQRFEFIWRVSPLSTTDDFRVSLSAEETRVLREQYETSLKTTLNESMADIWNRLKHVVTDMRDRLRAIDEGASKTVRDSIVTNITALLGVVPALNITGDTNIVRFCADIQRELTTNAPEKLREDPKVREDVIARADEILGKMSAYL